LQQLILQHAGLILSHPLQFRVVERSESSLPEQGRASAENARRAVLDHFVNVIQRGIKSGHFRRVDPRIAAFSIIGMCNWCAWWFQAEGAVSAEAVAASIAEMGLGAVASEGARESAPVSGLEAAALHMREALDVIETQLKASRGC
jgi:hypothetical protein